MASCEEVSGSAAKAAALGPHSSCLDEPHVHQDWTDFTTSVAAESVLPPAWPVCASKGRWGYAFVDPEATDGATGNANDAHWVEFGDGANFPNSTRPTDLSPHQERRMPREQLLAMLRLRLVQTSGHNLNCLAFSVMIGAGQGGESLAAQRDVASRRYLVHKLLMYYLDCM